MVTFSQRALARLEEIYDWNCEQYRPAWAQSYVVWLTTEVENIEHAPRRLRAIGERDDLLFATFKRSNKKHSHGYVVIYRRTEAMLVVLDIFHTAQDWTASVGRL